MFKKRLLTLGLAALILGTSTSPAPAVPKSSTNSVSAKPKSSNKISVHKKKKKKFFNPSNAVVFLGGVLVGAGVIVSTIRKTIHVIARKKLDCKGCCKLKWDNNSCFAASVVQGFLFPNKVLVSSVLKDGIDLANKSKTEVVDKPVTYNLFRIFIKMISTPNGEMCNTQEEFNNLRKIIFNNANNSEDAADFSTKIITKYYEEHNINIDPNKDLKNDKFKIYSKVLNIIKPQASSNESKNYEVISPIAVSFPNNNITLSSAISNYSKPENYFDLADNIKGNKKIFFTELPEFLPIQLKRFEYSKTTFKSKKISDPMTVEEKITVLQFDENGKNPQNVNFNLIGVVCQNGSLNGGHYVAYRKINGQWHFFDDLNEKAEAVADNNTMKQVWNTYGYLFLYEKEKNKSI